MSKIDLKNLTIEKAHDALMKGDFSAVELAQAYLDEIKKKNKDINAYLETYEDVLGQAKAADAMIKKGEATMLTGIPLALKDNILVKGHKVTASSKILGDYKATYDATVITKLKAQGAVILGRTNMDEFAMGSSTENSAFGVTKNPYDLTRVAGGSSGGAAAAVGMDGALFALGSDTGGSVRQPAAFCGAVGLKPTYGAVSRHGLMAMGSSLDQIGPVSKTVRDAEIIFNAITGHDDMDSTSMPVDFRQAQKANTNLKPKRIGVPRDFMAQEGFDKEVLENFDKSLEKLKKLGYEIVDIKLPNAKYSMPVYYILMPAEASTNLSRFDSVRFGLQVKGKNLLDTYNKTRGEGFGKEVRRRIMLGTYVLSHGYYDAYYNKANKVRSLIEQEFIKAFDVKNGGVDAIVTPTNPTPAFKIGEKSKNPLAMYLSDIFTVPANIAGIPAISIPAGMSKEGLPLDLHISAPHFREDILFTIGKEFENIK
jgi:aspartyl-tRNA(Asn)/glutamyl-tRNA(Gln) amidotransferase subunit A